MGLLSEVELKFLYIQNCRCMLHSWDRGHLLLLHGSFHRVSLLFFAPLHMLLPGSTSTWHTLAVLVTVSFSSSTVLTLAGNLKTCSPKISIILFACGV